MNDPIRLTPNEARQGRKGPMVRRMLIISSVMAIVLLAIAALLTINHA